MKFARTYLFFVLMSVLLCSLLATKSVQAEEQPPFAMLAEHCQPPSAAVEPQADIHHAGLVVTFGTTRPTRMFCIEFTEDSITGLELLERSGLPLVTSGGGLGAAVCAIDGLGSLDSSSYNSCFGQYPLFWAYDQYVDAAWRMSSLGASSSIVRDGTIEGWAWGANARPDPPGAICPAPTATPTVIALATTAPIPTSSPVPFPSAQPSPSFTAKKPVPATRLSTIVAPSTLASVTPPPAVIVSAKEGKSNAARSQDTGARSSNASGGRRGLIAFGAVATGLVALAVWLGLRRRASR